MWYDGDNPRAGAGSPQCESQLSLLRLLDDGQASVSPFIQIVKSVMFWRLSGKKCLKTTILRWSVLRRSITGNEYTDVR